MEQILVEVELTVECAITAHTRMVAGVALKFGCTHVGYLKFLEM